MKNRYIITEKNPINHGQNSMEFVLIHIDDILLKILFDTIIKHFKISLVSP